MERRAALRAVIASPAAPVVATIALGLVIRASEALPEVISDAKVYALIALGLVGDGDLTYSLEGLAVRGYTYPVFVATVYAISGSSLDAVAWVQALVLLPLTTLLVFIVGRVGFSRRVGLVAGWGFALWLPAAWHTGWLMTETWLALLMAALSALLATMLVRRSTTAALGAGVLTAVLSLSHPSYQSLFLVVPLAALVLVRERRLALSLAVGVATVVVPYGAFALAAGVPHLGEAGWAYSGGGGGWTFYVGSRAQTDFTATRDDLVVSNNRYDLPKLVRLMDAGAIEVEPRLAEKIREKRAAGEDHLTDGDFYRIGLENLFARPERWPQKVWRGLTTTFVLPDDPRVLGAGGPPRESWLRPVWRPLSILLAALACGGLAYLLVRRRDRLLVFVPALAQVLLLTVAHAEDRYGIPLWPSMFVLAAVAVVAAWERARPLSR